MPKSKIDCINHLHRSLLARSDSKDDRVTAVEKQLELETAKVRGVVLSLKFGAQASISILDPFSFKEWGLNLTFTFR